MARPLKKRDVLADFEIGNIVAYNKEQKFGLVNDGKNEYCFFKRDVHRHSDWQILDRCDYSKYKLGAYFKLCFDEQVNIMFAVEVYIKGKALRRKKGDSKEKVIQDV